MGYYADIDGDKTVDGIIYADLAVGGSGTWNSDSWSSYEYAKVAEGLKSYSISSENGTGFGNWEKPIITAKEGTTGKDRFYVMALEDFNSNSWSSYEYAQVTEGLKSYYISSENGTGFGTWEKPIITAKEGTTGKDRFYIMALEDFNPGTDYCWYDAASGKLNNLVATDFNDFGQGKTNTTTMIAEWNTGTFNDFGQGKTNTTTMIAEWNKGENGKYGAQNAQDMWGVIQKADSAGTTWDLSKWFVPSKAEWAAFGDMTYTKIGLTTSNYGNYGLKIYYWSSTQYGADDVYGAYFNDGHMGSRPVGGNLYVRLSATF